jgi:hypothetical protein
MRAELDPRRGLRLRLLSYEAGLWKKSGLPKAIFLSAEKKYAYAEFRNAIETAPLRSSIRPRPYIKVQSP